GDQDGHDRDDRVLDRQLEEVVPPRGQVVEEVHVTSLIPTRNVLLTTTSRSTRRGPPARRSALAGAVPSSTAALQHSARGTLARRRPRHKSKRGRGARRRGGGVGGRTGDRRQAQVRSTVPVTAAGRSQVVVIFTASWVSAACCTASMISSTCRPSSSPARCGRSSAMASA